MRLPLAISSLFFTLFLFLVASCGSSSQVTWKPNPFVGDYVEGALRSSENEIVYSWEERFNTFSCFEKVDIQTLVAILEVAEIPKKYKKLLEEQLAKIAEAEKAVAK